MSSYEISQKAFSDIEAFRIHLLSHGGEKVSLDFLKKIYETFSLLGFFPGMGRSRSDISKGLFLFPEKRFKRNIFYRQTPKGVRIVRVLSGYQDYQAIMSDT